MDRTVITFRFTNLFERASYVSKIVVALEGTVQKATDQLKYQEIHNHVPHLDELYYKNALTNKIYLKRCKTLLSHFLKKFKFYHIHGYGQFMTKI